MKIPRKKIIYKILILLIPVACVGFWALLIEPSRLVVKSYKLELKKWSPHLNGFKIVALADIHGGANFITEAKIREIVNLTNEQNPDLIVLLGDYTSRQTFDRTKLKMPLETVFNNLQGLKAKFGVFAIIGNHDNEVGNEKVRNELEGLGYQVLENEAVTVGDQSETIRLVGTIDALKIGNWGDYSEDVKRAIEQLPVSDGQVIVLSHNPDAILSLTGELSISPDFSLFIGGHTHGGQCRFPIIGAPFVPTMLGQKYAAGHIRDQGIDVFISSGIGTSNFPVRFGVPPEISVLELYQENQ